MSEALTTVSFEEFLEGEQRSECRHEWVGGFVYAMTVGTERHDVTASTLFRLLADEAASPGRGDQRDGNPRPEPFDRPPLGSGASRP